MEMFSHILIQLGTQAAAAGGDNATGQMPGRGRGGMAVLHWVLMLSAACTRSIGFTITEKAPTSAITFKTLC